MAKLRKPEVFNVVGEITALTNKEYVARRIYLRTFFIDTFVRQKIITYVQRKLENIHVRLAELLTRKIL